MTSAWSSEKMERIEDQLTVAFISTLRFCPDFTKFLFKKVFRTSFNLKNIDFKVQRQNYHYEDECSCRSDALIQFENGAEIHIENKFGAELSIFQLEKYHAIVRRNKFARIWFIYDNIPSELKKNSNRRYFQTPWIEIHRFVHKYITKKIHSVEKMILMDFEEFLEVNGVSSFEGLKKGDENAWKRSFQVQEQLEKYLKEFTKRQDKKISQYFRNFGTQIRKYYFGKDIYLEISKKTKLFKWGNKCELLLGFIDDFCGCYESFNDGPCAYVLIGVHNEEWNKIVRRKNRREFVSPSRGLANGRFEPVPSKGKTQWHEFVKTISLKKISGKRDQEKILDDFFLKGLRVSYLNLFKEVERYR